MLLSCCKLLCSLYGVHFLSLFSSYGRVVDNFPNPDEHLPEFLQALEAEDSNINTADRQTWDPIEGKPKRWLDKQKIMKSYKNGKCNIA